jgi:predicted amidohydrolase
VRKEKSIMENIKIVAVSSVNLVDAPLENIEHYDCLLKQICSQHEDVDLILFPEMCLMGFWHDEKTIDMCVKVPGDLTDRVQGLAKKYNCSIAMGIAEKDGNNNYITHFIVSPTEYLGKYRKIYSCLGEKGMGNWFSGGKEFPIFEINGFKIGINICYDNSFPENPAALAKQGAEILLAPFAINGSKDSSAEDWCEDKLAFLKGTSLFYGLQVIGCNHAGIVDSPDGTTQYYPGGIFGIINNESFFSSGKQKSDAYEIFEISRNMVDSCKRKYNAKKIVFNKSLYE